MRTRRRFSWRRRWLPLLAAGFCASLSAGDATLTEVREGLRRLAIDPEQTYRVRELEFERGGVKIYLTEGVLAFAKPIAGRCVAAVFTTQGVDAGDAEVLTLPPNRAERASLASFTKSPNLDEHFNSALFFFGDDTLRELLEQIHKRPPRPAADIAATLADRGDLALRSNADQIDVRLTAALLDRHPMERGFFYAMIGGRDAGTFDFAYQPDQPDPVTLGKMAARTPGDPDRGSDTYFQNWSSFRPRGMPAAVPPALAVSDYRIDAAILPDLSLSASARFDYVAQAGDGRVIPLLLSSRLQVRSASVDGQPAEVCQHGAEVLENRRGSAPLLVVAAATLVSGSHHLVEVNYGGLLIHKTTQGSYFVDERSAWYPFQAPTRSQFDLTFHCPEKLRVVMTGEPISEDVANGVRTVHRKTSVPEALAGFNIGEYSVSASLEGSSRVEVYSNRLFATPADIASQAADILRRYTALWGELPIHNLAISPIEGYFGQGFPGLIYLSDVSYTLEQDRPAFLRNATLDAFFSQMLLPHEVAHQWWGNIVSPADYRSNWILEALANYAALQYLESAKGRAVSQELLSTYRGELVTPVQGKLSEASGPVVFGERLLDNYGPGIWHDIIYEKGAWIFHMLRQRMGSAGFHEFQRRLLHDYAERPITNDDLRREAAQFVPVGDPDRSLNGFFDTWVYGTGIPTLSLEGGDLTVSGVEEDYLVDIPILCQSIAGKGKLSWVHAAAGSNVLPGRSCQLPSHSEFLYH